MIAVSAVSRPPRRSTGCGIPAPLDHVWVVLGAGVIGFLGNEAVSIYRIRVGRRSAQGPSLPTVSTPGPTG
jgi:hypothetical protein